jgi:NADH-quinone oxidoreductase subunit E
MSHTSQPVFDPNEVVVFSDSMMQQMNEVVKKFPQDKEKSALIRILHIAQAEYGWVSVPVMNKIAEFLKIQAIEVYEVATFYTMFHLQPVGKHVLEVCRTGPCMLVGSDQIIDYIGDKLGIKVGETSQDGMFTLKTAECLGACGYAPMLQCGKKYHEHLTKERVDEIIASYRSGVVPN